MSIFRGEGPRWFSIPAHRPFVEDLATGLLQALGSDPETLADAVVLTPTRRGARALAEAFVKANGGKAVLLPQIRALGDLDEGEPPFEPGDVALDLPPAITPSQRRFELARLVADNADRFGRSFDAAGAMEMADALGGFLDSCQIEEIDARSRLPRLVEAEMAQHFEQSADVLRIALEAWPKRLADLGLIDVSERRVALLRGLAAKWRETPPEHPLIAAGSTGTAPATADLLAVIASAPRGCVVLPGLDEGLADDAWVQVGEQHPQGAMKRLLERAGVGRAQVRPWLADADTRGRWRRRVINEALRPAEATKDWRDVIARLRDENPDALQHGLDGLTVTAARNEEEAAAVCALLLRETLEAPDKTAALVTPDRALARRVAARLARWGIAPDSSAGAPLAGFPIGTLVALVANQAADPLDPVTLLAILKHPLSRLGEPAARTRLERKGLRGPRPRSWEALLDRLAEEPEAAALATELQAVLAPISAAFEPTSDVSTATEALVHTIEAVAGQRAWSGPEGEAAAQLLAGLIADATELPPVTASQFAELIQTLISSETVRTGGATHPRLRILGAIEARLVRADRLILAGLEDGVWPPAAPTDPFLSRPMREKLGLPPPERRLGLTAHDFAQAACAPEVFLIHSERRDNAPAVESRWLWRLKTLAKGAGVELPTRSELVDWARALDAPLEPAPAALRTAARPRPAPPLEVRPRKLPVTGVERWVRDPYAVYARYILRLRPLERPDEPIEARARGTAIHEAFERFATEHPELPEDAETRFAEILVECLIAAGMDEPRMARERALAANVAPWVLDFERRRRAGAKLIVEQQGVLKLSGPGGEFTVTAKADRIELRDASADILDFKTGAPPTKKQVESGLSPQLTLTAAILRGGGFGEATAPGELVYVRVSGGRVPGDDKVICEGAESHALAEAAIEGLRRRIERFDDPATPYVSWAAPQFIHQFEGDYDHLARLWEWHVIGEGEEQSA